MASLNRIVLVGKLLADPETRISVDGVSITKFKMTVSNYPGVDQSVNWIEVIAWRRLAEVCGQYLKKGKLALVEGRLQIRSFEDQGGARKWVNEIVASNMQMLDGRAPAPGEAPAFAAPSDEKDVSGFEEVEELPEDDLPF
ncbi:MAG TPA: single-stranded DNA-binding protein [Candidatus Omnitrophota bacterium]|nr:single-stranded DNA-binding protein [Candidatus Omnitrophota bacterium]